jgi:hypothetical protein
MPHNIKGEAYCEQAIEVNSAVYRQSIGLDNGRQKWRQGAGTTLNMFHPIKTKQQTEHYPLEDRFSQHEMAN